MSTRTAIEANEKVQELANRNFVAVATAAAPKATLCNRFALLPGPTDAVLVLGNIYALKQEDGGNLVEAHAAAAVYIAKNVAEDLVVNLEAFFDISAADMESARARNATVIGKIK